VLPRAFHRRLFSADRRRIEAELTVPAGLADYLMMDHRNEVPSAHCSE
jgi:hypothetical protein